MMEEMSPDECSCLMDYLTYHPFGISSIEGGSENLLFNSKEKLVEHHQ